ncbi:PREDICTED: histone H1t-like [Chinchilla lanigera]|uniref:histone H1t-like n=1 Tax=Chinchilla lanigera TaxID=34839 RepID=UPI00038EB322|nr:PREDICTED: histone H1t-like [Chinchilla lanigera]
MSETLPAVPSATAPDPMGKQPTKRRGRKGVCESSANRKAQSSSLSKLITEALVESQDRGGMSLAALKKSLAATGYNVKKNNNRIKQALKSLVSKGVLLQIRGTGASGSFSLSKKAAPETTKGKVRRPTSAKKKKKLGLPRSSRTQKSTKNNRGAKQSRAAHREASGSRKKAGRSKSLPQRKSPAKARVGKAKTRTPRSTVQKAKSRKAVSKK